LRPTTGLPTCFRLPTYGFRAALPTIDYRLIVVGLGVLVRLIETTSGVHVWADKIDRPVTEIFDVMNEMVDGGDHAVFQP
jgi:hypothetical protein